MAKKKQTKKLVVLAAPVKTARQIAREKRTAAFKAINTERNFQEALKAQVGGHPPKSIECYVLYMDSYMEKLKQQLSFDWSPRCSERSLDILRKVAALAVACMEEHGAIPRKFEIADIVNIANRVSR
jgi:hypothetical protein